MQLRCITASIQSHDYVK